MEPAGIGCFPSPVEKAGTGGGWLPGFWWHHFSGGQALVRTECLVWSKMAPSPRCPREPEGSVRTGRSLAEPLEVTHASVAPPQCRPQDLPSAKPRHFLCDSRGLITWTPVPPRAAARHAVVLCRRPWVSTGLGAARP